MEAIQATKLDFHKRCRPQTVSEFRQDQRLEKVELFESGNIRMSLDLTQFSEISSCHANASREFGIHTAIATHQPSQVYDGVVYL